MITYVLTQRWSDHSQQLLQWIFQWQDGDAGVSAAAPPNKGQALQCIQNVNNNPSILEFDPSKGFNNSGAGQAGVSNLLAEEELHMKRKLEEEAKQQEENAKRQKQEEDGSKLAAKTCVDDPRQNLDFVVIEMESPKASVGVRGDQVILASSEATNKKVPKNAVLVSWSKDAALVPWTIDVSCKADIVNTKEWIMNWKTEVLWRSDVTNKLVKKHNDYPSVRRYFSHMFPKVYIPKARYSRKKIQEDEQKARRQAKLLFLEAWPGNRLSTTKERYNLRRI